TNYQTGYAGAHRVLEDRNGEIWFTRRPAKVGTSPVCRIVGRETQCLDSPDGAPFVDSAIALIEDARGALWFGGSTTLVRRDGSSQTVYQPSGLKNNQASGFMALAAAPDDTLWIAIASSGPGLGLQRLVQGKWQSLKTPELDGDALVPMALRLDEAGSLW